MPVYEVIMDLLFVMLGFIPMCAAIIWVCDLSRKGEMFYTVGILGCISLGVFGISLTGTLRSFAASVDYIPQAILCGVCLVTAIICGYVYNKRT